MHKKIIPEIKFCFSFVYNSFFEKFVRLPRSKDTNYARSWMIVNDLGYEKIIDLIKK